MDDRRGFDRPSDEVTGLPQRHSYEERLTLEAERARRYRYPLALVHLRLNDPAGDDVLRDVATAIRGARYADECFRIGHDEFAILMPHTDLSGARIAAERLAAEVETAGATARWGAACEEGHPAALHQSAGDSLLGSGDGRVTATG